MSVLVFLIGSGLLVGYGVYLWLLVTGCVKRERQENGLPNGHCDRKKMAPVMKVRNSADSTSSDHRH